MQRSIAILGGALLLLFGSSRSARADTAAELSPVVVTATRVAESSFDIPASIDRVDQATRKRTCGPASSRKRDIGDLESLPDLII